MKKTKMVKDMRAANIKTELIMEKAPQWEKTTGKETAWPCVVDTIDIWLKAMIPNSVFGLKMEKVTMSTAVAVMAVKTKASMKVVASIMMEVAIMKV